MKMVLIGDILILKLSCVNHELIRVHSAITLCLAFLQISQFTLNTMIGTSQHSSGFCRAS